MANATTEWLATVASSYARLTGPQPTIPEYLDAHRAFHLALLAGCSNRQLFRTVAQLHDHTQRFQVVGSSGPRRGNPAVEHAELYAAVMAGDARRAVTVLSGHLRATLDAVTAQGRSRS